MSIRLVGLVLLAAFAVGCGGADKSGAKNDAAAQADGGTLYTCSMHPNVLEHEPGVCPQCGMNLVPVKVAGAKKAPVGERKIKYWVAPMDPTYIRDEPGKSPMGMDLVPVYEDEVASEGPVVEINPQVVQNMGVRMERLGRTTLFRHLRTIGQIEVGEDEEAVVNLRFSGWVEKLYVERTGDLVRRGQTLFRIYSPELVAAEEELLLAVQAQGADSALARSARRKLELWDIPARDIDAMLTSGKVSRTLPIRAPSSGYVLHKGVVEGARIKAGQDLYRIADLDRIWVTAEVYEFDAPWVEEGQAAQMELSYEAGRVLEGKVSYVYPTLNPKSRTLTVRLEFDNPGVRLKPGMFATVNIQYRRIDDVIAVPSEAILNSGKRQMVFVSTGPGTFEPHEITTGLAADHHMTEVLSGLSEGDIVVTSGQYLIDSESQLQEAIQKMLARKSGKVAVDDGHNHPDTVYSCPMHPDELSSEAGRCSQCGMDLEERPGTPDELKKVYGKKAAAPGQYTCSMHPEVVSDEPGSCPICGMFLEQVPEPGAADEEATP